MIPFIPKVADALASFIHTNHIVTDLHGNSFTYRLPESSNSLDAIGMLHHNSSDINFGENR